MEEKWLTLSKRSQQQIQTCSPISNARFRVLPAGVGPVSPGTRTYPVNNEDLAGLALLLKLSAGDGHGVEEAKAPGGRRDGPASPYPPFSAYREALEAAPTSHHTGPPPQHLTWLWNDQRGVLGAAQQQNRSERAKTFITPTAISNLHLPEPIPILASFSKEGKV